MTETLTIGSLFSGYGGLDMAVEAVTGATPAWFVEFDAAPSKILAHHWPDVPNYHDVTTVDWHKVPPVDIITGGSPCQDLSSAGKRAGMTEGTRSNLWVNMREAITIIRPRLVVWENVKGALSAKATSDSDMEPGSRQVGDGGGDNLRALGRVLGDLAEIGYDAQWTTLRASDIGAPHHRARVFLVAYPSGCRPSIFDPGHDAGSPELDSQFQGEVPPGGPVESGQGTADAEGSRRDHGPTSDDGPPHREVDAPLHHRDAAADAADFGRIRQRDDSGCDYPGQSPDPVNRVHAADAAGASEGEPVREGGLPLEPGGMGGALDGGVARLDVADVGGEEVERRRPGNWHNETVDWGPYAPAVRRWERLTRPAPAPTEPNTKGKPRLNAAFAEWMMGIPEGHVTQVPGVSRSAQLKAVGNGVCPPQAAAALRQLLTSPAPAGHFA